MKFDWNPDKAGENERNHSGITFEEAVEVFFDLTAFEDYDDEHSERKCGANKAEKNVTD